MATSEKKPYSSHVSLLHKENFTTAYIKSARIFKKKKMNTLAAAKEKDCVDEHY